jgi:hypothetical protein
MIGEYFRASVVVDIITPCSQGVLYSEQLLLLDRIA